MKATFDNTVNILVKAYLNGTLEHCDCNACVVGNLVASSMGYDLKNVGTMFDAIRNEYFPAHVWVAEGKQIYARWQNVFGTFPTGQRMNIMGYREESKYQIDSTGYSVDELARIENTFETAPFGRDREEWMFNGLIAVVDVLAEIHGIDLKQKESAKALFVK